MNLATPTVFRIRDWDTLYEWSTTRERPTESFRWIKVLTKQGSGYRRLVTHKHGGSHYGAWVAILQVASRSFPRGTLIQKNGRPHTACSLAADSLLPSGLFAEVLPRLLSSEDVGWVEEVSLLDVLDSIEYARAGAGSRTQSRRDQDHDHQEQDQDPERDQDPKKKKELSHQKELDLDMQDVRKEKHSPTERTKEKKKPATKTSQKAYGVRPIDEEFIASLESDFTYNGIDIRRELGKMRRWCQVHKNLGTRRRFVNWLNNAEPTGGMAHEADRQSTNGSSASDRRTEKLRTRDYQSLARTTVREERDHD